MLTYISLFSCDGQMLIWSESPVHSEEEALCEIEDALYVKRRNLGFFYVETVILSEDGIGKHVRRVDFNQELEKRACIREFEEGRSEDCSCGKHKVYPVRPDAGIMDNYIE